MDTLVSYPLSYYIATHPFEQYHTLIFRTWFFIAKHSMTQRTQPNTDNYILQNKITEVNIDKHFGGEFDLDDID